MTFQLEKTPWLPPAPADFSRRCKALAGAENGGALAATLLPSRCLRTGAPPSRALKKARATTPQMPPLSNFTLGVLASFTADLLLDCVPAGEKLTGGAFGNSRQGVTRSQNREHKDQLRATMRIPISGTAFVRIYPIVWRLTAVTPTRAGSNGNLVQAKK